MSRSTTTNKKTGEKFPKKSRGKNGKDKKFFGFRYGDASKPNAKKGKDFINDGYPLETRHKSVIKQHIQNEISKGEMDLLRDMEELEELENIREKEN